MYTKEEEIAIKKYKNGEIFSVTTFIDEETIMAGYGHLSTIGIFEYELPYRFRVENDIYFGCRTWNEYYKKSERIKKLERITKTK